MAKKRQDNGGGDVCWEGVGCSRGFWDGIWYIVLVLFIPPKTTVISYWKRWYSIAMLVYRRVYIIQANFWFK